MKVLTIGDATGIPIRVERVGALVLRDIRYLMFYHDEYDAFIMTDPLVPQRFVERVRQSKKTCLFLERGWNSLLPGGLGLLPTQETTVFLREGSWLQELYGGVPSLERTITARAPSNTDARDHRLPISGHTQSNAVLWDLEPEDHPFLVGMAWMPSADDPIWDKFLTVAQR